MSAFPTGTRIDKIVPSYEERINLVQGRVHDDLRTYSWDDMGLGELFAHRHINQVIYNEVLGWRHWDQRRWRDGDEHIWSLTKSTADAIKRHANKMHDDNYVGFAKKVRSTGKRTNMLREARAEFGILVQDAELNQNPMMLPLWNGTYDLEIGDFIPGHDPCDLNTRVLPVAYYEDAVCPGIDKYLGRVQSPEMIPFLEEISGYCLLPGNHFKKAIMLHGTTDTGKSVFLKILIALLGDENVTHLTLHTLTSERFARTQLFGKLANIAGDLDSREIEKSDTFMMITGGDKISGEMKYGNKQLHFKPDAKLVFSANELPPTTNQTAAYFNRWLIVPFDQHIPDHEQIKGLEVDLTVREELSGWLLRSIAGLQRLLDRGHFDPPEQARAAWLQAKQELDSLEAYIGERHLFADNADVRKSHFYSGYTQWCRDSNRVPLKRNAVYTKMQHEYVHRGIIREAKRDGYDCYIGIGFAETTYSFGG